MTTAAELNPYLFFGEKLWDDDPDNDGVPNGIGAPSLESAGEVAGGIAAAATSVVTGGASMVVYSLAVAAKNTAKAAGKLVEGEMSLGEFALTVGKEAVGVGLNLLGGVASKAIQGMQMFANAAGTAASAVGSAVGNFASSAISQVGGFFANNLQIRDDEELTWMATNQTWGDLGTGLAASAVTSSMDMIPGMEEPTFQGNAVYKNAFTMQGFGGKLAKSVVGDSIRSLSNFGDDGSWQGVNLNLGTGLFMNGRVGSIAGRDALALNMGPNGVTGRLQGATDKGIVGSLNDVFSSFKSYTDVKSEQRGIEYSSLVEEMQAKQEELERKGMPKEAAQKTISEMMRNKLATRETMYQDPLEQVGRNFFNPLGKAIGDTVLGGLNEIGFQVCDKVASVVDFVGDKDYRDRVLGDVGRGLAGVANTVGSVLNPQEGMFGFDAGGGTAQLKVNISGSGPQAATSSVNVADYRPSESGSVTGASDPAARGDDEDKTGQQARPKKGEHTREQLVQRMRKKGATGLIYKLFTKINDEEKAVIEKYKAREKEFGQEMTTGQHKLLDLKGQLSEGTPQQRAKVVLELKAMLEEADAIRNPKGGDKAIKNEKLEKAFEDLGATYMVNKSELLPYIDKRFGGSPRNLNNKPKGAKGGYSRDHTGYGRNDCSFRSWWNIYDGKDTSKLNDYIFKLDKQGDDGRNDNRLQELTMTKGGRPEHGGRIPHVGFTYKGRMYDMSARKGFEENGRPIKRAIRGHKGFRNRYHNFNLIENVNYRRAFRYYGRGQR